jgi:hypothetical protein
MISERASQRAFFGGLALLFAASVAGTIVWCASMSAMGAMLMPGGWTMSMAWTRMPGQTWPGTMASFLGMWVVMMMAMMVPSLVPMLLRYRQAVGRTGETRLGLLTVVVGMGYFFVWTGFGMAAFLLGVALAAIEMQRVPVHCVEITSSRLLPRDTRARLYVAGRRRHGLAIRPVPRPTLQPVLCRPDRDPSGPRGRRPSGDGRRGGSHHSRTSHTGQ